MGTACSTHGQKRNTLQFWWESQKERPLERSRRRWEDNIKMELREIGWGGMDWVNLAQGRDQCRVLVNMVMNLQVPKNVGKFLSS
jgi:hypothetical protein